jgi:hypothetical protein
VKAGCWQGVHLSKEENYMTEEVYCRCCGQKCQPKKTYRPAEDYDGPGNIGRLIEDWVSHCCGDALSEEPVTDRCGQCGKVATRDEVFPRYEGQVLCPGCLADLFKEHPDMEQALNEVEWQMEDR